MEPDLPAQAASQQLEAGKGLHGRRIGVEQLTYVADDEARSAALDRRSGALA
jgi:hypothetical protein